MSLDLLYFRVTTNFNKPTNSLNFNLKWHLEIKAALIRIAGLHWILTKKARPRRCDKESYVCLFFCEKFDKTKYPFCQMRIFPLYGSTNEKFCLNILNISLFLLKNENFTGVRGRLAPPPDPLHGYSLINPPLIKPSND